MFLAGYFLAGFALPIAVLLGAGAWLGFRLAFGTDPTLSDIVRGGAGLSAKEVVRLIGEARRQVDSIRTANKAIPCPELTERLKRICGQADRIIGLFQRDPGDIRRGQKFLDVYLSDASTIAAKYAELDRLGEATELDARFRELLIETEDAFERQYSHLLENDKLSLDVDIEVLSNRLKREGLR